MWDLRAINISPSFVCTIACVYFGRFLPTLVVRFISNYVFVDIGFKLNIILLNIVLPTFVDWLEIYIANG